MQTICLGVRRIVGDDASSYERHTNVTRTSYECATISLQKRGCDKEFKLNQIYYKSHKRTTTKTGEKM